MTVRDISAHLTEPYGELDLATTPELCARIDSIRQRRARALILDLPGTDFCDSTGLRALRDSHRTLAIQRARLVVIVPPDGAVARLFDIAGARALLELHPTITAGMAARRPAPPRTSGPDASAPNARPGSR